MPCHRQSQKRSRMMRLRRGPGSDGATLVWGQEGAIDTAKTGGTAGGFGPSKISGFLFIMSGHPKEPTSDI